MCKTIKLKAKFKAAPGDVYRLLADTREHSAFSGRRATISTKVGGSFSAESGRVSGVNVDLVPGKRLVQAWRSESFPEGIFSMAAFVMSPSPQGGTQLVLTHRGVPKDLIPKTEKFWRQNWIKMRDYLASKL